jgi:hypothetical protein
MTEETEEWILILVIVLCGCVFLYAVWCCS